MKRFLLGLLFINIIPVSAQMNVLLLQKKQKSFKHFYTGAFISLETIDKNYADGIIARLTNDSIYIQHFDIERSVTDYGGVYLDTAFRYTTAIHIKAVGAIVFAKNAGNRKRNGAILMIAGGGVLVLGAVNGLYRGDPPKDWYKPSGYITAGVLTALGLWMSRSAVKRYYIGKKYHLKVLQLTTP